MKSNIVKIAVVFAAVCALSAGVLIGCTSTPASNTTTASNTANASNQAVVNANQNVAAPATQAQSFDLTKTDTTSQDVKDALSVDDKNRTCEIKMAGAYEAKERSNGTVSHVIHLYIDGKDWKESIYCDLGTLTPPENGAMVTATGTWKHTEGSQNDTAFTYYVSDIKAAA